VFKVLVCYLITTCLIEKYERGKRGRGREEEKEEVVTYTNSHLDITMPFDLIEIIYRSGTFSANHRFFIEGGEKLSLYHVIRKPLLFWNPFLVQHLDGYLRDSSRRRGRSDNTW
jgi:hypothetical protein